jgi:hypothetical protein
VQFFYQIRYHRTIACLLMKFPGATRIRTRQISHHANLIATFTLCNPNFCQEVVPCSYYSVHETYDSAIQATFSSFHNSFVCRAFFFLFPLRPLQ